MLSNKADIRIQLPNLEEYQKDFLKKGVQIPLPIVPFSNTGLLAELPPPPVKLAGLGQKKLLLLFTTKEPIGLGLVLLRPHTIKDNLLKKQSVQCSCKIIPIWSISLLMEAVAMTR